jgi:hypothetical protein
MLGRRRRRALDEKETLQAEFNCIRERAINNDEPTAIVLCEDHDQLTIDSFSVKEWLPQGGEEIVILAHEEARARAWRTWLIDIVVVPELVETENAFEMAWQARDHYRQSRAEVVV